MTRNSLACKLFLSEERTAAGSAAYSFKEENKKKMCEAATKEQTSVTVYQVVLKKFKKNTTVATISILCINKKINIQLDC